jgi:hypothetical protein
VTEVQSKYFVLMENATKVLSRTEQARRVATALSSLHWLKYISANTKKRIFCRVIKRILVTIGQSGHEGTS